MSDKIARFPVDSKKRKRLKEKQGRIECEVSGRWIQLPEASNKFSDIEYLHLDIMTLGTSEMERKLCELILDKEQLLKMLNDLPVNDRNKTY